MIDIVPAIDIIGGKCVRLTQGDYDKITSYDASPVDMVKRFRDYGLTCIHAVDLDGAKSGHPVNLRTLEEMASVGDVEIEWGGGLKRTRDLEDAMNAGATYQVIGSVAARDPEKFLRWLSEYGTDSIVLGADVKDGKIAVAGWLECENMTINELLDRFVPAGLNKAIVTDVARDGMLRGVDFNLYTALSDSYPDVEITVSGGVSTMDDIVEADELGLARIIVGKAIYEGRIKLKDLENFIVDGDSQTW